MSGAAVPIAVRMVDVREPLRPLDDVAGYPRVRVYVADGGDLVGAVDIFNARRPVTAARLRHAIADSLGYRLAARSVDRGLRRLAIEQPTTIRSVSIVVPSCDRPEDLRRCLTSICTQRTRHAVEVIVVDNRPGAGPSRAVAREFAGVRIVDEARPGLSYARNAGFAAATGDILVATDDDVMAPPEWIEKLVAAFERPEVAVVTGNVLPLELETESQYLFEAYGGLGKGFDRIEADGAWFHARRGAVPTWTLGATANAAFRASVLAQAAVGLLDPALGAGTPTGCSEDTYLFYRILKAGFTIAYEPSAYVWHRHRASVESLRNQIYAYSKGHVAYHLTTLQKDRDRRALVRLGWGLPKTYVRRAWERLRGRSEYPLSLIALEVAGTLAGPWALWKSRSRVRQLGPGASLPPQSALAAPQSPVRAPVEQAEATHHDLSLEGPLAQDPRR